VPRLLFFARALRKCIDPLLVPPTNGRNKPSALRHPLIASAQYALSIAPCDSHRTQEKQPCPTPFDCTASWQRSPTRSIAPSPRRPPRPSGCRPTALPATCLPPTPHSAAPTECHSAISPPPSHTLSHD